MISDYFRLAFNNLRHRQRRSWLTIIGTLIGIMAVVSLISIGQGLENSIQSEFEELGGDKIFITPGGGISASFSDTTFELTDDDREVIRATRGVEDAAGRVNGQVRAQFKDDSQYISLVGITTDTDLVRNALNIEMDSGRYIRSTDTSNLIVGSEAAENMFEDEVYLRSQIRINNSDYRVVGITEDNSNPIIDSGVIVPIEEARDILEKDDTYDAIVAQADDGFKPSEVEENIAENLRRSRDVEEGSEDFQTQTADDLIRSFQNQLSIVRSVLVGIAGISLLVGGVGIMNTMYTSVTERTREIGVMKAVGATNKQIMFAFMVESGIIGLIGGLIGVTLGIAISILATGLITQRLGLEISASVTPELLAGALLFSFVVGTVSGVLPARRAAGMKPAEALSYD